MGIIDSAIEGRVIERAIIEIIDLNGRRENERENPPVNPNGGGNNPATGVSVSSALGGIKNAGAAAALQAGRMAAIADGQITQQNLNQFGSNTTFENAVRRQFKVQFNPSTLKLNAFGGGKSRRMNFVRAEGRNEGNAAMDYAEVQTHIEFSVELIFDEMDLMEAFTTDSLGAMAFTGARKIGSAIGNKTGLTSKITGQDKRPSVQEEIEAFLALMRDRKTRGVTFAWGGMIYSGVANGVSGSYTLFNPSGKPVRGKVRLRMVLADESVGPGMLGYWGERYNSLFNNHMSMAGSSGGMFNFNK